MQDPQALYDEVARADEERWVRSLVGCEEPTTDQKREQALMGLVESWIELAFPTNKPEV
ncbi:hypothetical protein [Nocardiopsis ganjiahuensis]|uniref:hypothetical protein n=1 Tax=Nocardiopsis ganjiahuensis TaxID=239984 RepID=UPI0003482BAF|nr:hypothetical protein [Nocardiopsis ganjiahuensis]